MGVEISALVATYNRAHYLRKALQSLIDQSLPQTRYEIIVVDNGSNDETRDVVAAFESAGNVRYFYEPVTGVSRARNTGWRNAQGEYVAFLDDDGVASRDWLENLLAAFRECRPTPGMVGGRIEGIWEAPKPDWLSDKMLGTLGIINWGSERTVLQDRVWLPLGNMATPASLLERTGGFREDLDRQGTKLRGNGEVYFGIQLKSLGFNLVYDPQVLMYHHVMAAKLTQAYFRNWFYWQGLSNAVMMNIEAPLSRLARVRISANKLAWVAPRLLLAPLSPRLDDRFRRRCQVAEVLGLVRGLWQLPV
jgi:glucosyl-dolichyl phosphate glucuronosyltransferase